MIDQNFLPRVVRVDLGMGFKTDLIYEIHPGTYFHLTTYHVQRILPFRNIYQYLTVDLSRFPGLVHPPENSPLAIFSRWFGSPTRQFTVLFIPQPNKVWGIWDIKESPCGRSVYQNCTNHVFGSKLDHFTSLRYFT